MTLPEIYTVAVFGCPYEIVHMGHVGPRGAQGGAPNGKGGQTLKIFVLRYCVYEEFSLFMAKARMAPIERMCHILYIDTFKCEECSLFIKNTRIALYDP